MIALRLVRLIEHHSDEIAVELETSAAPPTYTKS